MSKRRKSCPSDRPICSSVSPRVLPERKRTFSTPPSPCPVRPRGSIHNPQTCPVVWQHVDCHLGDPRLPWREGLPVCGLDAPNLQVAAREAGARESGVWLENDEDGSAGWGLQIELPGNAEAIVDPAELVAE